MPPDATDEDLRIIAALADELLRRVPALAALTDLRTELIRVHEAGRNIRFDMTDVIPIEELERAYVAFALERCGGNRSHAAEALGIDPSTLYRKLGRWGLGAGDVS